MSRGDLRNAILKGRMDARSRARDPILANRRADVIAMAQEQAAIDDYNRRQTRAAALTAPRPQRQPIGSMAAALMGRILNKPQIVAAALGTR